MNPIKLQYFRVFSLLFCLRAGDLYITHKITPDLQLEWNPLVSQFHFSWLGLLVARSTSDHFVTRVIRLW